MALLGIASGAAPAWTQEAPSVLLISIDTLRRDHLGCYGYPSATSPAIDALARRGVTFDGMTSTSSWTLPSHASMLTGRYPSEHGLERGEVRLGDAVPTVAERFRGHGYRTIAVVSNPLVSSEFGIDRGFDSFDDGLARGGVLSDARQAVDRFLLRLDEAPAGPLFAFLHFNDPHFPVEPPAPLANSFGGVDLPEGSSSLTEDERRMFAAHLAGYDGEIRWVDEQLSRLWVELGRRGKLADLAIVLTSDHGEEFLDHGGFGHGITLYTELLGVPLILSGSPAWAPGTIRREPASPVDLAPSLLSLVGSPGDEWSGRPLMRGGGEERVIFAELRRPGYAEVHSARVGRFKVVSFPEDGVRKWFDLSADPGEASPLPGDPTGGALGDALDRFLAAPKSFEAGGPVVLPDGAVEQLRALGYVE